MPPDSRERPSAFASLVEPIEKVGDIDRDLSPNATEIFTRLEETGRISASGRQLTIDGRSFSNVRKVMGEIYRGDLVLHVYQGNSRRPEEVRISNHNKIS